MIECCFTASFGFLYEAGVLVLSLAMLEVACVELVVKVVLLCLLGCFLESICP